jgi:hypothetical protein
MFTKYSSSSTLTEHNTSQHDPVTVPSKSRLQNLSPRCPTKIMYQFYFLFIVHYGIKIHLTTNNCTTELKYHLKLPYIFHTVITVHFYESN